MLLTLSGDPATGFGQVVGGAGDVNDDGYDDIIWGEPHYTNQMGQLGRAIVTSGRSGKMLLEIPGRLAGDLAGFSVCGLGDVDGDAVPDVLIGVLDITSQDLARSARVHSGADGSTLFTIPAGPSLDQIDLSMDAAGDVDGDGDGHADILVGTLEEFSGGFAVFSGDTGYILRSGSFEGDPHVAIQVSVQGGGDLNDDGFADSLVAIHQYAGSVGITPSRGRVVFGGDPWFIRPGDRIRDGLSAGQQDSVRFDAVAGTRLDLSMKSFGKPKFEPALTLTAPSGWIVLPPEAAGIGALAKIRKLILPDTGTYTVEVSGGLDTEGGFVTRTKARTPRGKARIDSPDSMQLP